MESWEPKLAKSWDFFHLVKHSWDTMGHPYGKLKQFDLVQLHYFGQNVYWIRFSLVSIYYKTSNRVMGT